MKVAISLDGGCHLLIWRLPFFLCGGCHLPIGGCHFSYMDVANFPMWRLSYPIWMLPLCLYGGGKSNMNVAIVPIWRWRISYMEVAIFPIWRLPSSYMEVVIFPFWRWRFPYREVTIFLYGGFYFSIWRCQHVQEILAFGLASATKLIYDENNYVSLFLLLNKCLENENTYSNIFLAKPMSRLRKPQYFIKQSLGNENTIIFHYTCCNT